MEQRTTKLWNNQTRARLPVLGHATMFEYGTWDTARRTEDGAWDRLTTSIQSAFPATTLSTAGRELSPTFGSPFPTDSSRHRSRTLLSPTLATIKASTMTEMPH